ncbi:TIGR02594 family protein [Aureimonas ureilytica]|uniref:TIGR02594 family protein n=1 Tax=Aureimonas ureilytica TaxID=401562 RepID=UPI003CE69C2B
MEAGRVSVAVEVTGLDQASSDMQRLEKAGEKAAGSVKASMGSVEKQMASLQGIIDRSTSSIVAAVDRLNGNMTRGFAQVEQAMGRVGTGASKAEGQVSKAAAGIGTDLEAVNKIAARMAAAVQDALKAVAPATAPAKKSLEDLRAQFNPLFSIGHAYRKEVDAIRAAHAEGAIGASEMGDAIARAGTVAEAKQEALRALQLRIGEVGERARLTSNQLLNLSRQGNDALTMYFSGSDWSQILATQAGQIYGALEEGPNGVRGSLQAIRDSALDAAKAIGPIGLGLAAAGVAAAGLWYVFRDKVQPIDDLLKQQTASVKELAEAYGLASVDVEKFGQKSVAALQADALASGIDSMKRQMADAKSVMQTFSPFDATGLSKRTAPAFAELSRASKEFGASVEANAPAFAKLSEDLARIELTTADDKVRRFAKETRDAIAPNVQLEQTLSATTKVMSEAERATLRMGEAYRTAMAGLAGMVPDLRTEAERVNSAFADAAKNARSMGDLQQAIEASRRAMAPITDQARDLLDQERANRAVIGLGEEAKAVAQVNQQYDALAQQYRGNAEALLLVEQARAQAIDNAGSQAAFDREQEANKEREAAAKRAIDEAQRYAEATRSRIAGIDQAVASQRLELDMFGQTEGASAALRFEFQALTAAKQAAAAAGGVVSEEELAKIREASAEVGRLTEQLAAKNAARSAVDQFFPFEAANREAERLGAYIADVGNGLSDLDRQALQMQIDRGFVDAASAAENLRTRGVKAGEDIGRSFIENVGDVFADIFSSATRDGESFFSSILRGFAGLGSQLAAAGAKNLFGKLFGFGTDQSAAGVGGIGAIGGSYSPPVAANSNYNVGAVTSAPLMALNDNLAKTSRSALDVARQFDGLNERADSKVLNSFLQASGNWKGLSTADTAWCAAFANASIMQAGGKGTGSNLASSFLNWGTATNQPKVGDVVVLRPQARGASGHVGFVAGFGDGTVQIFGGNQSASAKLSNYSTREVVGYRTGTGTQTASSSMPYGFDQRALQRATSTGVKDGLTDYSRQASYGDYIQAGVDPWNSGGQNLRQAGGGFGQTALGALGAGLGIFGQGYQSGSPLQGGFSGALGGYQAAGALGFTSVGAGIAGGVLGAGLGILGGILGARKQREQEHRQKAAAWEQMRPAYEAFDASLSGEGKGDLRKYITDQWGQLSQFMSVGGAAWKMGKGNSTAQFDSTGRKLFEGFLKMLSEFQQGFDSMITDMSSGQGLQGAFAKGRAATKDLASQLKKTRDDIDIAFGNIASIDFLNTPAAQQQAQETERQRADAIARYNDAAAKYALSLLYTAEKVSDVQQTIDGLRGTAAGLVPIFKDLGWNADEAARVIDERLNQAIANIARGLEQNLADRIDELSGRSYLTSVRSFLEEYEGLQRDFSAAGADASRLPEFFKLQAQSIVDGAELTGDAFAELVRLFPQLSGVVSEFVAETVEAAKVAESEIADAIRGYEDRLADVRSAGNELAAFERRAAKERTDAAKFGADALASLEKTLAAERAAIVLSQAKAALEQSYQAETDRINELLNARRDEASELESTISKLEDFRDQVKEFRDSLKLDDNLSTLNAKDRVDEAGRQFRELLAKARGGDEDARGRLTGAAQEYLNEAKGYYQTSTDYGDIFEEVNRALADTQATTESALSVSQSQLDALKRQITLDEQQLETNRKQYEAILGLNEGIKSLEVAFREYAAAAAAARAAGITVPGTGGGGSSSGGANYDAPRVPGVNVSTESAKYLANNADVAAAIAAGQTFGLPAGMAPEVYASAHFGLHGQTEGRKWATGGLITGPGTGTSDSIPMWASNGEFMMREAAVSSVGAGTMDYINRTGRLPTIAMPASPRMVGSGNDNRGIEQRLDAMQRTLIALTTTTGGGLQRVAEAGEAGARATEQRALAERRSANNKQAA